MKQRAKDAERCGDPSWMPQTPPMAQVDTYVDDELALWIAELADTKSLIGVVGLYSAGMSPEIPPHEPAVAGWRKRKDLAELRRLRVDPKYRRQGIATALNDVALGWAREHGFSEVVLNTTAAQRPALALYRKLGFSEIFSSFVGEYELVWMSFQTGKQNE